MLFNPNQSFGFGFCQYNGFLASAEFIAHHLPVCKELTQEYPTLANQTELTQKYITLANQTAALMRRAMNGSRPVSSRDIYAVPASRPDAAARNRLIVEAYLIQGFTPEGINHPLYKAATTTSFEVFEAGIEAYRQEHGLVNAPFTEYDYVYGSNANTTHGESGYNPKLTGGAEVCYFGYAYHTEYATVAKTAAHLMRVALGDLRPKQIELYTRTSSVPIELCEAENAYTTLVLETYFMQEFMPAGDEHPLYKAATEKRFTDFMAGVENYILQQQAA